MPLLHPLQFKKPTKMMPASGGYSPSRKEWCSYSGKQLTGYYNPEHKISCPECGKFVSVVQLGVNPNIPGSARIDAGTLWKVRHHRDDHKMKIEAIVNYSIQENCK